MLILQGTLRAAAMIAGGKDKEGKQNPERPVLQIETTDNRGLVKMDTITVPDLAQYADKVGKQVNVPVRAWAPGATVNFVYELPGAAG